MDYEQRCVEACNECAVAGESCLHAMLDDPAASACADSCRESIQVCLLCAQSITRKSQFIRDTCFLCAKVCKYSAEECGRHPGDDCQRWAEACRRCVQACLSIVEQTTVA